MSDNLLRLKLLFEKYAQGASEPVELEEMWTLMQKYVDSGTLTDDMKRWWDSPIEAGAVDPALDVDGPKIFGEILQKEKELRLRPDPLKSSRRLNRWPSVAAAVILLLLCSGGYFFFQHAPKKDKPVPGMLGASVDVSAPMSDRAVIQLANGQLVYLDSSQTGMLAVQGSTRIDKLDDGKIDYSSIEEIAGTADSKIEYNTLTNPRGSKVVNITLSDGSRVWLNAGSSLTYPVKFTAEERRVTMSGEAYFEVQHNSRHPFQVKVGNQLIEDLGTQFNVSAYTDEPVIRTTLLEGAVKLNLIDGHTPLSARSPTVFMKPGEQAILSTVSTIPQKIELKRLDNPEDAIAWKSGYFRFKSTDIASIMREAARWYNVDVEYEGYIKGTITGGISRSKNISELLRVLELTGKVQFTLKGRKIIVHAADNKH